MPDIIKLLPDNIANQIAAGEVIQRPASAVKELMENAVDAGATEVRLVVQDAGKQLIQVIDNGSGMSDTDARMCFERHATSKIRVIDDLFHIETMGFRGEALASIAAVAQVELKTRTANSDIGTYIEIENSQVQKQEPVACPPGTSIAMKNLFFNVPARRNFLKSNAAEMRHIVDEFTRVAMAFPHVLFTLTANGQELMHLEAGSMKQRIVQLLGNSYTAKLVSVKEHTDYLTLYGFVGKPETARKTRGDQYFFVNRRFIKSAYLNHAVMSAFQEMIPADSFPMYALFIDLDPAQVDVNVHPTKQEIKFEDEKLVYAFVQAAVKHGLAQYSITPTLDFELDPGIQQLDAVSQPFTTEKKNATAGSSLYQTFTQKNQAHFINSNKSNLTHWKDFYEAPPPAAVPAPDNAAQQKLNVEADMGGMLMQLHHTYILVPRPDGFLLVHQQLAHERILYEQLSDTLNSQTAATQQSMFPATVELSPADTALLTELLPDLHQLGYAVEHFGKNTFIIQGTPAGWPQGNDQQLIENLLEQFKHSSSETRADRKEKLLRSLARQRSIKAGQPLSLPEMEALLDALFACRQPNTGPGGQPTLLPFSVAELDKLFGAG